jgi:hypothetical protein
MDDLSVQGRERGTHEMLVTVTIDGNARQIERGKYQIAKLKEVLGVPADYELDEVKHGEFKPLDDNGHIHIEGREVFVSHVRRGGAS